MIVGPTTLPVKYGACFELDKKIDLTLTSSVAFSPMFRVWAYGPGNN